MNRLSIFIFCLLFHNVGFAQQEQIYTHYDMNSLSVNPAYAGSNAKTTVSLLSRRQWTSLSGAPNYNTLTASHALNNDFAMGLTVKQGSIGESPVSLIPFKVNWIAHFVSISFILSQILTVSSSVGNGYSNLVILKFVKSFIYKLWCSTRLIFAK